MLTIPDLYLSKYPIPQDIRKHWHRWEGVNWRIMRYADKHNGAHPQDQRFTVTPPPVMCPRHYENWYAWRNRHFMLQPEEIMRGMAFPADYIMLGTKRDRVKLAGNAVCPPNARDLISAVAEALS